jgi:hypothetical protein
LDVAERLETQSATVERNVRVPANVEESADDLMDDGVNIAALAGKIAEPSTTRLSEEARRQLRLSLARRACRIKFNRSQTRRRMAAFCAHRTAGVDIDRSLRTRDSSRVRN